jgi:hypothetical protein
MSAVDEAVVREYFESHGFLVCQRRKYLAQTRQKSADEEINFMVLNPRAKPGADARSFVITPATLATVPRAIVAVKGWHTEIFSLSVLRHQPKIFRFLDRKVIAEAERLVGADGLLKILVISCLPRAARARQQSIEYLRQKGVDGVLEFQSILEDLAGSVKTNRNYQKSDLLQILRLLKRYGLLKDPQLEFKFKKRGKKG